MKKKGLYLLGILFLPIIAYYIFLTYNLLTGEPQEKILNYGNRKDKAKVKRVDFKSAKFCGECHVEIYEQWSQSYLSKAYTGSKAEIDLHKVTLKLRGIEPQEVRFCLECHAPLALTSPEDLDVKDPLSQEGVTCVVCHSVEIAHANTNPADFTMNPLKGMMGPFSDSKSPVHKTGTNKYFDQNNVELCATCHYSLWPKNDLPIDWTYKEWLEAQGGEGKNCKDCHMPKYRGKAAQLPGVPVRDLRRHDFHGGHHPAKIREAADLSYTVVPKGDSVNIDLEIKNNTGHSLPTGNGPAPEVRLIATLSDSENDVEVFRKVYRTSYQYHSCRESLDPTIAHKMGKHTALVAYENRKEKISLAKENTVGKTLNIKLVFSYWRPYEKEVKWQSFGRSIFDHMTNKEVTPVSFTKTIFEKETWDVLLDALDIPERYPVLITEENITL